MNNDKAPDSCPETALIKTAAILSLKEKEVLKKRLEKIFGRPLKLKIEKTPDLIGGLIIKVGEKVIDLSLLGEIKNLKEYLKK